jgi:hypothetical protein
MSSRLLFFNLQISRSEFIDLELSIVEFAGRLLLPHKVQEGLLVLRQHVTFLSLERVLVVDSQI